MVGETSWLYLSCSYSFWQRDARFFVIRSREDSYLATLPFSFLMTRKDFFSWDEVMMDDFPFLTR